MKGGDSITLKSAGIPNITGKATATDNVAASTGGAFYVSGAASCATGNYESRQQAWFDASRSNAIYGASTTVQPPAISLIPQIKF